MDLSPIASYIARLEVIKLWYESSCYILRFHGNPSCSLGASMFTLKQQNLLSTHAQTLTFTLMLTAHELHFCSLVWIALSIQENGSNFSLCTIWWPCRRSLILPSVWWKSCMQGARTVSSRYKCMIPLPHWSALDTAKEQSVLSIQNDSDISNS